MSFPFDIKEIFLISNTDKEFFLRLLTYYAIKNGLPKELPYESIVLLNPQGSNMTCYGSAVFNFIKSLMTLSKPQDLRKDNIIKRLALLPIPNEALEGVMNVPEISNNEVRREILFTLLAREFDSSYQLNNDLQKYFDMMSF